MEGCGGVCRVVLALLPDQMHGDRHRGARQGVIAARSRQRRKWLLVCILYLGKRRNGSGAHAKRISYTLDIVVKFIALP